LSLTLAKGKYPYFYCLGPKNSLRHKTNCTQPYVMACDAETGVEDLYKKIQLPEEWVKRLAGELEAEIVERQTSAGELHVSLTKRLAALAEERQKLLRAYYANAISPELLKRDSGSDNRGRGESQVRACRYGGGPRQVAGATHGCHWACR
jgi:hypothetical protein